MAEATAVPVEDIKKELLPEAEQFEKQAALFVKINTPEEYEEAGKLRNKIVQQRKRIKERFEDPRKKAKAAYDSILETRDSFDAPLSRFLEALEKEMKRWYLAKKEAEEKEARRLELEAKEKAESAIIEEAEHLERMGQPEAAAAVISQPVPNIPLARQEPGIPKVKGLGVSEKYKVQEPVDLLKLVKAIAEGKAPLQAVKADLSFLNSQAGLQGKTMCYDGVTLIPDVDFSDRSRGK